MEKEGALSEGVLPAVLRDLYVGRKTGTLRFTHREHKASVLFDRGQIIRAETNVLEGRLGETLVKQGLLSEVDFNQATDIMTREGKRLGQALEELGILDREKLEEALALHVRETLRRIFSWHEGSFLFEDAASVSPEDGEVTTRLSTAEMILEAARLVEDPDVVRYALGNIDRILGLSSDPLLRFQKIALTPADGYILSRIDGTLSVRELIKVIPIVSDEVQRSLFGLLCTGIVEYLPLPPKEPKAETPLKPAPPPPPPPPPEPVRLSPAAANDPRRAEILEAHEGLKTRNHFETLGILKTSTDAQVKEAYFRLARRYHPDTHTDPNLADLRDKIEAVFIRLGQAYEVLRSPRSRGIYEADLAARTSKPNATIASAKTPEPEPDRPLPPNPRDTARQVEEAVKKAEARMAEEKYWDAIQLLEQAVAMAEGRPKQKARVLLAKCYLKNPKWVKRAEEALQTIVQEDPQYAEPYFVLGGIYKTGGLKSRALSMFRKVVELKPDHEEAQKELEAALSAEAPEPPQEGGGLFKKLFGK